MQILVIDVGGTNIKVLCTGQKQPVKIPSGPAMTARRMVASVQKAAAGWKYEVVSIGYPGPVLNGSPWRTRVTSEQVGLVSIFERPSDGP